MLRKPRAQESCSGRPATLQSAALHPQTHPVSSGSVLPTRDRRTEPNGGEHGWFYKPDQLVEKKVRDKIRPDSHLGIRVIVMAV